MQVKNFDQIKKDIINCYIDNWNINDDNNQVEEWINSTYPDVNVRCDNDNQALEFVNDDDLDNARFIYDDDQWIKAN